MPGCRTIYEYSGVKLFSNPRFNAPDLRKRQIGRTLVWPPEQKKPPPLHSRHVSQVVGFARIARHIRKVNSSPLARLMITDWSIAIINPHLRFSAYVIALERIPAIADQVENQHCPRNNKQQVNKLTPDAANHAQQPQN